MLLIEEIDFYEPAKLFQQFANKPWSVLLDTTLISDTNQFSFIGIDPFLKMTSKNQSIWINDKIYKGNPFRYLKKLLNQFSLNIELQLCPFQGGAIGYFGYDLRQHLEKFNEDLIDEMQFPDMCVGFYDLIVGFDLKLKKAWIFSSGYPEKTPSRRKKRAIERKFFLLNQIKLPTAVIPRSAFCDEESPRIERDSSLSLGMTTGAMSIQSNFNSNTYQAIVKKSINAILKGDIFEVNLSQRFTTKLKPSDHPFELYKRLITINPTSFSSYLNFDPTFIVSASPEQFLKLQNKIVTTKPIKGTCQRHEDSKLDNMLSENLLSSDKDRAENTMIVDLMRNDLSRVCENHSILVPKLCELESFSAVHHLVSTVTGKLHNNKDAIDLLMATFPGGSVTGAPKIRAMEIISEIEKVARGPYCGSIGYIGFNGDMDMAITIRTFAIKDTQVVFQTGGAIVLDSDPLSEYEETLDKAKPLFQALRLT